VSRIGRWLALASLSIASLVGRHAQAQWQGQASLELRAFPEHGLYPGQEARTGASLALEPRYSNSWENGKYSLSFEPFLRIDQRDAERTHVDLRELVFQAGSGGFELRLGVAQVFWGVLESRHVVDVINQVDNLEDVDGEVKLGQPLLNVGWVSPGFGTLEAFLMLGFREREHPGPAGRLRLPLPVLDGSATFDSSWRRAAPDVALRWSGNVGVFDFGLAFFHGTGREPQYRLVLDGDGLAFQPRYDRIYQLSLDSQVTLGGVLLKLEALGRSGQGKLFSAISSGVEYTTLIANADLGLLAEYHHDDRYNATPMFFDHDAFLGVRLAVNDVASTEVRAGIIVDVKNGARLASFEASRRWGETRLLRLRARLFATGDPNDALHALRRDDYVELETVWYF
jgi:hypothetical protein